MVLETPIDRKGPDGKTFENKQVWADEIKLLERLIGMDPEGEEFKGEEARFSEEGKEERERIGDQVNRKAAKDKEKQAKAKAKGKTQGKKTKATGTKGRGRKKVEETDESE